MRGKALLPAFLVHNPRITPAYAGKRRHLHRSRCPDRDHPRLCGEKFLKETFYNGNKGSPPPMRGKGKSVRSEKLFKGITPAYAGKRSGLVHGNVCRLDHPRLCGEKQITPFSHTSLPGITPAYAGKSYRRILACPIHRDHPRLCGEKFADLFDLESDARITPAYAGKSTE